MSPPDTEPLHLASDMAVAAFDSVDVAVLVLDPEGWVRAWNGAAQRLLGIPAGEAIGRRIDQLPVGWDGEALRLALQEFPGRPQTIDRMVLHGAGGTQRAIAIAMRPFSGQRDLVVWTCTDLSSATGDPIMRKLAVLGGLAAGIGHEINTPMQFIGDNARFLSEAVSGLGGAVEGLQCSLAKFDPEAAQALSESHDLRYLLDEAPKAVAQTLDGVQRVAEIVKAMKEFAHPGSDDLMPTDINHAITSTLTLSRNVWKYVAETQLELDPDMPMIPVAPGAFQQVILNLIVNATHAIEDQLGRPSNPESGAYPIAKGRITIRTAWEEGYAVVEVGDTGCGMSPEVRSRIFDLFFTTKEAGRGTGQGLAMVRAEVVGRLRGHIEVESTPGLGTLFRLTIPGRAPGEQAGAP